MIGSPLTVTVSYNGQICMLAASGDLDLTNATRFARCAFRALDEAPERLVFDLSGLSFVDCTGARSLVAVAQAAPEGCPVVVRSVSPPVARMLGLLGVDLEHLPARRPELDGAPVQPRAANPDRDTTLARVIRAAKAIAVTEEQVAATFARLADQRPDQADQLTAVSRSAYAYATQTRRWAHHHQALTSA
jgi:anti-sigma B factor antagonist